MGPRTAEKIKKRFMQCFENINLKITVQSNIKVVNYLDITLNLLNGKFYPNREPNDKPLYINTRSNHPPSIILKTTSQWYQRTHFKLVMRCRGIRKSNPGIQRGFTKRWFHATASLHRQDQYRHRKEQEKNQDIATFCGFTPHTVNLYKQMRAKNS